MLHVIVLVMFENFAKLDSPRRLVQFWKNFQTLLVLLIPNCTRYRMITYTNIDFELHGLLNSLNLKILNALLLSRTIYTCV